MSGCKGVGTSLRIRIQDFVISITSSREGLGINHE